MTTADMMTLDQVASSDLDVRHLILEYARDAENYLGHQSWCHRVQKILFGAAVAEVAVFWVRVEMKNGEKTVIWMVVGEVPPRHIATNEGLITTPAEALFIYCRLLISWFYGVKENRAGPGVPVLLAPKTLEPLDRSHKMVEEIDRTIGFLMGGVIPYFLGENSLDET